MSTMFKMHEHMLIDAKKVLVRSRPPHTPAPAVAAVTTASSVASCQLALVDER